jgi:TolB-like protein
MQVHKTALQNGVILQKSEPIAVAPFYNYTQTPLAGYSAAAIATVLLKNHGFQAKELVSNPQKDALLEDQQQSRKEWIQKASSAGYQYLLTGEVTEWHYKTGIDAQPVVGLVVQLIDTKNGEVRYSSSGSKDALPHGSISSAAQTLLDKMLP